MICLRSSWGVWGPNQDLNPNFICLFISGHAGSSLLCGLFSSVASRGHSLVVVPGLLAAVTSLVVARGL